LTDEEWALVEPLIAPAKRGGDKRTVEAGEVVTRSRRVQLPFLISVEDLKQVCATLSPEQKILAQEVDRLLEERT